MGVEGSQRVLVIGGDEYRQRCGIGQLGQHVETRELGHLDVHKKDVGRIGSDVVDCLPAAREFSGDCEIVDPGQEVTHALESRGLIVDNYDSKGLAFRAHRGLPGAPTRKGISMTTLPRKPGTMSSSREWSAP